MVVPERLRWAVETLEVAPGDRILEIGCGRGVAVALICDQLGSEGKITAIDRSAKAIEAAEERNAAHVSAGQAAFHSAALENVELDGDGFDKIFAVNVNLFWVRRPTAELELLRGLLNPDGALYLFYEPPSAGQAGELESKLTAMFADHGYATTSSMASTTKQAALLCVRARPR